MKTKPLTATFIALPTLLAVHASCNMSTYTGNASGSGFSWEVVMETFFTRASYSGESASLTGWTGYKDCSGTYHSDGTYISTTTAMSMIDYWAAGQRMGLSTVMKNSGGGASSALAQIHIEGYIDDPE